MAESDRPDPQGVSSTSPATAGRAPSGAADTPLAWMTRGWPGLALAAAVFGAYFFGGKVGLSLASVNASVSPVWPPTGIALAALLLFGNGPRVWVPVWAGAFLVNYTTQGTAATSVAIATGNALEGVVGAWLVVRFADGFRCFQSAAGVVKFSALAAAGATVISATIGVTTLGLAGLAPWPALGPVWFTWWVGDAVGAVVLAPALVVWAVPLSYGFPARRIPEAGAALGALAVASWLIFFGPVPQPYLSLPVLLLLAFRFGPWGVATGDLVVASFAAPATLAGGGPFGGGDENPALLSLQAFVGIKSMTMLIVASILAERRRARDRLKTSMDALEGQVQERTRELTRTVAALEREADRRRAEEGRFRALVESAPDAMVVVNEAGNILLVNSQCEGLFGYSRAELVGQPVELLVPEGLRAAHVEHRARYASEPRPRSMGLGRNLHGRRKDGTEVPVEISLSPSRGPDGWVFTAAIRDVTERRGLEEKVRRSEQGLREAQALAQVGSWDWDIPVDHVSWSDELYQIYGPRRDEFPSSYQGFLDRVHADDRPAVEATIRDAYRRGGTFSFDHRIVRPDGGVRWLHARGRVERAPDGTPIRMSGTGQDITDRRRLEAEAAQNRAREAEVERLREMNEFRARFLSTAAHELNTPLTPLRLQGELLEVLLGPDVSPDVRKSLDMLNRNTLRLSTLVRDLLEAARLQVARVELQRKDTDLGALIQEAIESYGPPFREAGVELRVTAPPDIVLPVDPNRVSQVLFNLLSNALKFTPEGGRVAVTLKALPDAALVEVKDTGLGLSKDQIDNLFQPFTQVHTSTHPGTGLGLFISRGLVELHGGRLWAESPGLGKGSRFLLQLPKAPAAPAANPPEAAPKLTTPSP